MTITIMKSMKTTNAENSSTLELHGHSRSMSLPSSPLAALELPSLAPAATTLSGGDYYDHCHTDDNHSNWQTEEDEEEGQDQQHQHQHQQISANTNNKILNHELHRLIDNPESAPLAAAAATTNTIRALNNNHNASTGDTSSSTSTTGKKRSVLKMRLFKIFKKKQSKNSKKSTSKLKSGSDSHHSSPPLQQHLDSQYQSHSNSRSRSRSQSLLLRQRQELEKSSLATLGTIDLSISDDVHGDHHNYNHGHLPYDHEGGGANINNTYNNYDCYEEDEDDEEDQHGLSSSSGSALSAMRLTGAGVSLSSLSFSNSNSHHSYPSHENTSQSNSTSYPNSIHEAEESTVSSKRSDPSMLDLNLNSSQIIFHNDNGNGNSNDQDKCSVVINSKTATTMDNENSLSQCRHLGVDDNYTTTNNNNNVISGRDRDIELEHSNQSQQQQKLFYDDNDHRDNQRQQQQHEEELEQQNQFEYENQKIIALFQAGKEMYASGSYQMALQMQKQALRVVRSFTCTTANTITNQEQNLDPNLNSNQLESLTTSSAQQRENQLLHQRQAAMIEYEIAKIEFVIFKEKKYYSLDNHDENDNDDDDNVNYNDSTNENNDDKSSKGNNTGTKSNSNDNNNNYSDARLSYLYDRMKNAKCIVSLQDVAYYEEKLLSIGNGSRSKTFQPQPESQILDQDSYVKNDVEKKQKGFKGRRRRRQQQKQEQLQQQSMQTQQLHQQQQQRIVQILEKEEVYQKIQILHALAKLCHKDLHKFHEALEYYNQALELECAILSYLTQNGTNIGTSNVATSSCTKNNWSNCCNNSNVMIYEQHQHQGNVPNNNVGDVHHLTELYREEEIKEWKIKIRKTKKKIGAIHYLNGQFDMALFSSFSFGCQ
eukprot:CAMPEP_0203687022 /NCGR_PEP_ID=MMETSP0090-20130426/49366_1 /ASSEMBLY_ACC=CAM_ASM_001088 /TAXON_ID=426623 /ORGANISM="Chaetoceros affinis, Strain CCMP159" /LENGTH=877 /DNA_ID=CAMNT_0050556271 /DNA_START=266 /DNA_END=2899 /DNA_ORIENTATION=+